METQATTYSLSGPTTRKAQTRIGPLTVVAQLNRTTGEPYGVRFYDACGMLHCSGEDGGYVKHVRDAAGKPLHRCQWCPWEVHAGYCVKARCRSCGGAE